MAFYTRNGDGGRTSVFPRGEKISKDSPRIEALGALDELNSLLGLCKVKAQMFRGSTSKHLAEAQEDLFVLQAEIAGSPSVRIKAERTSEIEKIIDGIEKKLPKIKSFMVPGGSELSALLDCARTAARRAERRVVALRGGEKASPEALAYLNRLSSLLFALARLSNKNRGIKEEKPKY